MKKFFSFFLMVCFILSSTAFCVSAQSAVDESIRSGSHSADALMPLLGTDQLITNAKSIMLYEAKSDTLLYSWNADEQLPPSSLVKIMTAMLAIENGDLSALVTVESEILNSVPAEAVDCELQIGELLTLEQLLYCMMVGSANDAAVVIAHHIAGSQQAFIAMMNERAQALGCTGTNFMNVHGLHDELQYTTARDVTKILAEAIKSEQFRTIFGTVTYTVPQTNKFEERSFSTGNYLMNQEERPSYYDSRVTGGRTGVTEYSDRCIAATAEKNGLQVISIVMGAESVYEESGVEIRSFGGFPETTKLLDAAFDGYSRSQIIYQGQILKQCSVTGGDCDVMLGSDISVSTVLPAEVTYEDLSFRYTDAQAQLTAPIAKGTQLSIVQVYYGSLCVGQASVYAMNDVSVKQAQTVTDPQPVHDNGLWTKVLTVIGMIAVVLILIVIIFRIIGRVRLMSSRKRSLRYKKDRRRSR